MFERNVIQKRRVAINKKPMKMILSKYECMNSSVQQATWPYQNKSLTRIIAAQRNTGVTYLGYLGYCYVCLKTLRVFHLKQI